jgi:uncharacterized coiled-coil protein SlyX
MAISVLGDGCPECQPETYLDMLQWQLEEQLTELPDMSKCVDVSAFQAETIETLREVVDTQKAIIEIQDKLIKSK